MDNPKFTNMQELSHDSLCDHALNHYKMLEQTMVDEYGIPGEEPYLDDTITKAIEFYKKYGEDSALRAVGSVKSRINGGTIKMLEEVIMNTYYGADKAFISTLCSGMARIGWI